MGVGAQIVDDCDYIITKLADITKIALNSEHANFGVEFRSPGYMPLLNATPNLLNDRRGQTELFIVLA